MRRNIKLHGIITLSCTVLYTSVCAGPNSSSEIVNPGSIEINGVVTPLQSMHPDLEVLTKSLPNTSDPYEGLKTCPKDPVCPDINGNIPDGKEKNCPDNCIVVRSVNQIQTNPNRYNSVVNAVCPVDYIATHVYNMGIEIVYDPNPQMVESPITAEEWKIFKEAGYICSLSSKSRTDYFCNDEQAYVPATVCGEGTVCNIPNNRDLYITNYKHNNGILVQITNKKSWPYCKSYDAHLIGCAELENRSGCSATGEEHYWGEKYTATEIQCRPPDGFHETSHQIPTALVCTHVQPVWR